MSTLVAPKPACRHCRRFPASRPRGLCWRCFYTPDVRTTYPVSGHRGARRGVGNANPRSRTPAAPTWAHPGTDEKLEVLTRRAAAGEALFHPADGRVGKAVPNV